MGRRENPIGECSKTLNALASWLRARRESAGLSYEQLAARSKYSAATLTRAASGRSVPKSLEVVQEFATACGVTDLREVEKLWKHARRDEGRARDALAGYSSPANISLVRSFADLHSAMLDIYRKQGSPTLRALEGGHGHLPRSTVSRVLQMRTVPNRALLLAFAEACGVHANDLGEWGKAWDRAHDDRRRARVAPTPRGHFNPRDLQQLMSIMESTARRRTGLKLMVRIPTGKDTDNGASEQAARELMVDQAVRSGELSCPGGCGQTSFGYDKTRGWAPIVCENCKPPTPAPPPHTPPAPRIKPNAHRPSLPKRTEDEQDRATPPVHGPDSKRPSQSAVPQSKCLCVLPHGPDDVHPGCLPRRDWYELASSPTVDSPTLDLRTVRQALYQPSAPTSNGSGQGWTPPPPRPVPKRTVWPSPPTPASDTQSMHGSDMPILNDHPVPDEDAPSRAGPPKLQPIRIPSYLRQATRPADPR